jgi:acetyl-CoA carboxylase biotin carboxylase subunit
MFSRVLIANRGEIALRVIRACRELGIQTVVVYSQADRNAAYLRCADEAICIGAGPAADSYLNIPRIISAAEIANVDAIHPGYGFLAENSHFAEVCESCKIKFIGPSSKAMAKMGDKVAAKAIAKAAKVPLVPGSEGAVETENDALKVAHQIGFPIMIKAAGGGGGRGMRVAHNDISLVKAFFAARAEAEAAFKNPTLYIEKYVENPRHVEIQILGDEYGNLIHLNERDCSCQRRHQKLVEESPCPVMTPSLRDAMGAAALRLAKSAGYYNAGTVEFLVDKAMNYYFIEVNARIQVEHPVTEMVTGMDLVKEQIRIASGEKLTLKQRHVPLNGCAIEARINAEDPANGYAPSPGRIQTFIPPGGLGVRLDTHVYGGYEVPPMYDSLIAKLIVHRPTRLEAITTMRRALGEFVVHGVKTTIPLLSTLFSDSRYVRGETDTGFVETLLSRD